MKARRFRKRTVLKILKKQKRNRSLKKQNFQNQ